jgi:hypothetical protein
MPVILFICETAIRRIVVKTAWAKIVHETPSQKKKPGMLVYTCNPSNGGKSKIGRTRIVAQASLGKK